MSVHELKVWPSIFRQIVGGNKTAEIRKCDRDFSIGDTLALRPFDPDTKTFERAHPVFAEITHIQYGFGLQEGYAMLSFKLR